MTKQTSAIVLFAALWASIAVAQVQVETLVPHLDGNVGGVTVDALGYIYVADFGEKVWKITPFGEVEVLVDSLYGSSGNVVDPQGNLLQASFNANSISKISRDGSVSEYARGLKGPVGLTLDGEGMLYVCNCLGNSLSRVTPEGEVLDFAASPLFNCPNGITRDPEGNLYVVNFSDGQMLKITTAGEVSAFAQIPGGGNGHVVWAAGKFIVTGFRSNKIYQVTREGEVSIFAGTGEFSEIDGVASEATFSAPNGIAFSQNRQALYLNDKLVPISQRLKVPPTSSVRKITLPSLTQVFMTAYQESGITAAETAYQEYRAANPSSFTQIEVNILGYRLMQSGQVKDAIRVFELNTEAYPKSFNPWDSLAEANKVAGNKKEAIRFYRKSLELNPANDNAVKMLKELGVKP